MRKSTPLSHPSRGNISKYDAYREAWTRIKQAQDDCYYIEALAIEESIISDRLISYLVGVGAIDRKDQLHQYPSFSRLLKKWKRMVPQPVTEGKFEDLCAAMSLWSRKRNAAIHHLVKSHPGTPTGDIESFLAEARQAAEEGKELARAVSAWHKKQLRKATR